MSAPPTKVFGRGLARTLQAMMAVNVVANVVGAVSNWRSDGGSDWLTLLSLAGAAVSAVAFLLMECTVVRVERGRIRWWTWRGRRTDLAVDEVADVRRHPAKKNRVQLVTTDGRVLRLPVQRDDGPAVWWHLFGDTASDASRDRG